MRAGSRVFEDDLKAALNVSVRDQPNLDQMTDVEQEGVSECCRLGTGPPCICESGGREGGTVGPIQCLGAPLSLHFSFIVSHSGASLSTFRQEGSYSS